MRGERVSVKEGENNEMKLFSENNVQRVKRCEGARIIDETETAVSRQDGFEPCQPTACLDCNFLNNRTHTVLWLMGQAIAVLSIKLIFFK